MFNESYIDEADFNESPMTNDVAIAQSEKKQKAYLYAQLKDGMWIFAGGIPYEQVDYMVDLALKDPNVINATWSDKPNLETQMNRRAMYEKAKTGLTKVGVAIQRGAERAYEGLESAYDEFEPVGRQAYEMQKDWERRTAPQQPVIGRTTYSELPPRPRHTKTSQYEGRKGYLYFPTVNYPQKVKPFKPRCFVPPPTNIFKDNHSPRPFRPPLVNLPRRRRRRF